MKRLLQPIFLTISKLSFAACSLTFSSVNLGNYNQALGNSIDENFNSTCVYNNWLRSNTADFGYNIVLTNGNSTVAPTFSTIASGGGGIYIPVCSGQIKSGTNYQLYSNGIFCTTVSIPPNLALSVGTYIGSLPLAYQTFLPPYTQYPNIYYTLPITLTVIASCTISTSGIAFGSINGGDQTIITGAISTTCTNGTTYTLTADGGNSANILARTMKSGSNSLNYQIYTDSSNSTIFGNETVGSSIALTGTGAAQSATIYGKVFGGQIPTPGNYTDTVNITLTY